jgi:secernin
MCDTLCVPTRDAMLFAKSSDRHPDEPQVVEWHPRRSAGTELRTQYVTIADADAYAFVGSRPTWLWGVEHGVNEHGVAIGNERIWTTENPAQLPPALIGMDLVRLGLERARTAGEAVDVVTSLLERHGQGGSGEPYQDDPYFSSFLVVDVHGGYVVETSGRTWAARHAANGAAISNRVTLGTDWTRASAGIEPGADFDAFRLPAMPTGVADHRLTVTRGAVARGPSATADDLAHTLRSHGPGRAEVELPGPIGDDWSGFTVCMHRRDADAQTTASMIAELRPDATTRVWACLGNPCCSVYVPAFPPAVPAELADPAQWSRFARLRDLVESDPPALAGVRRDLAAVERALWAEADEVDRCGDPAQAAAFSRRSYAPVAAALRRLGV